MKEKTEGERLNLKMKQGQISCRKSRRSAPVSFRTPQPFRQRLKQVYGCPQQQTTSVMIEKFSVLYYY
ncbi:hypothetical protein DW757_08330 [Clostridium sp. AM29-11AC]|nr:hypothetical protein DW757_08330 [Clostridium sp. AM29-11AC]